MTTPQTIIEETANVFLVEFACALAFTRAHGELDVLAIPEWDVRLGVEFDQYLWDAWPEPDYTEPACPECGGTDLAAGVDPSGVALLGRFTVDCLNYECRAFFVDRRVW